MRLWPLFQRWSLFVIMSIVPHKYPIREDCLNRRGWLNSQIYCKTTWGVVENEFHCWTSVLKREKSSCKPEPWMIHLLQIIKHPQSCVYFTLLQRGSRCFFQVHSTCPREVRWWLLCSWDTRGNGPRPAALVGIKKENCFANLATSLNRRFLFFIGSQKATVSRHDGNEIWFSIEMRAAWRSSWPLTWCPKCYRNSHKYHFKTVQFLTRTHLSNLSLQFACLRQLFPHCFLQNINLTGCAGIGGFMAEKWHNTACYVPFNSHSLLTY